jgi:hypothetical protein
MLARLADRLRGLISGSRSPAPPDMTLPAERYGQQVLEAHYSPARQYRALVTRETNLGVLRVRYEIWDVEGTPCWVPTGADSLCDSLDRARVLAAEELALVVEVGAPHHPSGRGGGQ